MVSSKSWVPVSIWIPWRMLSMLSQNSTPSRKPAMVPMTPMLAPDRKKMRMIMPAVAPMVRRMAMSRPLSLTSMIMLETMLKAATTMISVRMRNMTFLSTWMALKKVEFTCCQSWTWPLAPMTRTISMPSRRALSGLSMKTSRLVTASGRRK